PSLGPHGYDTDLMEAEIAALVRDVEAARLTDAVRQRVVWLLQQLPDLYGQFQATYESRYRGRAGVAVPEAGRGGSRLPRSRRAGGHTPGQAVGVQRPVRRRGTYQAGAEEGQLNAGPQLTRWAGF